MKRACLERRRRKDSLWATAVKQPGALVTGKPSAMYGITNEHAIMEVLRVYDFMVKVRVLYHRRGEGGIFEVDSGELRLVTRGDIKKADSRWKLVFNVINHPKTLRFLKRNTLSCRRWYYSFDPHHHTGLE